MMVSLKNQLLVKAWDDALLDKNLLQGTLEMEKMLNKRIHRIDALFLKGPKVWNMMHLQHTYFNEIHTLRTCL